MWGSSASILFPMQVVTITHSEARDRGIYPTESAITLWEARGYDCSAAKKAHKQAVTAANKAAKSNKGVTD